MTLVRYNTDRTRPSGPADVQVRVRRGCIVEGRSEGTVFWLPRDKARMYAQVGSVQVVTGTVLTQAEQAIINRGPEVGKSSDARLDGPSTDSASSNENGSVAQSSALVVAPALPLLSQPTSSQPANGTSAVLSQSTTPTNGSRTPTSSTSPTTNGGRGTRTGRNSRRGRN
jgi:hypothetical protein